MRCGGFAIESHCPKLVKVMNGSIQKCEGGGVKISIDDPLHKNEPNLTVSRLDSQQQVNTKISFSPEKNDMLTHRSLGRSLGTARGEERKDAEDPN